MHGSKAGFFAKGKKAVAFGDPGWYEKVHGANVLQQAFPDLSEHRVTYDNVLHGVHITRQGLAANDPVLRALAQEWLVPLVKASPKEGGTN